MNPGGSVVAVLIGNGLSIADAWVGVGSMATAAAVIIALAALVFDRRDRRASEKRQQAIRVTAWLASEGDLMLGTPASAVLSNASDLPVYRVVAWMVLYQGAGAQKGEDAAADRSDRERPALIGVLPPGQYRAQLAPFDPGMFRRPAVEVGFTDAAGRHWIRRHTGRLAEIGTPAPEHYGLGEPLDWNSAEPDQPPRAAPQKK